MAEPVIDLLEMVQIDKGQRQGTVVAQAGIPLHLKNFLAAVAGEDAGQVIADGPAQQRHHVGQLAHAGQAGDPGDQDQQPEGADKGWPVQRRPVQVPGQPLGQQQDRCHQQVLQQGQREQRQPGHQHKGQKGVPGGHRSGHVGQLVVRQQGVRANVEQGGNGKQDEHGQVGVGHMFPVPVEQQQAEERQTHQHPQGQQLGPQRIGEGNKVDHPPQRGQQGKQQSKQTDSIDNQTGPVPTDQQWVMKGREQLEALVGCYFGR